MTGEAESREDKEEEVRRAYTDLGVSLFKLEKVVKVSDQLYDKVASFEHRSARLSRSIDDMSSPMEHMGERLMTKGNCTFKYKKDMTAKKTLTALAVNILTEEFVEASDNMFAECKVVRSLLPKA